MTTRHLARSARPTGVVDIQANVFRREEHMTIKTRLTASKASQREVLTAAKLDTLIEEATVDAYGESEQVTGFYTMLEDAARARIGAARCGPKAPRAKVVWSRGGCAMTRSVSLPR